MRQNLIPPVIVLLFCAFSFPAFSQSYTITGTVRQTQTKVSVPAVSVTVKGTVAGTFTDDRGHFRLTTAARPPIVLIISSIGFETQEVTVRDPSAPVRSAATVCAPEWLSPAQPALRSVSMPGTGSAPVSG